MKTLAKLSFSWFGLQHSHIMHSHWVNVVPVFSRTSLYDQFPASTLRGRNNSELLQNKFTFCDYYFFYYTILCMYYVLLLTHIHPGVSLCNNTVAQ